MAAPSADRYARYALGLLTGAYVLNYVDRQIVSILAEHIKLELGVDDAQLGYLYGTVFAVFYAVFGIPLGRLADVWDRRRLLALGLGFWSAMTALSAFARTFPQLALARMGVGIGEASANPAAYSMLCDLYPRARRATALAFYSTGIYIGTGLGLGLGGLVADRWGWRVAFLVAGLPGLALAFGIGRLREPARAAGDGAAAAQQQGTGQESPLAVFWNELRAVLPPFSFFRLAELGGRTRDSLLNLGVAAAFAGTAWIAARAFGNPGQWWSLAVGAYAAASWCQSLALRDAAAFRVLFATRSLRMTALGLAFTSFSGYGFGFWTAPFFVRVHGLDAAHAGLYVGGAAAAGGWLGVTLGGLCADRWRRTVPTGRLRVALLNCLLSIPACLAMLWVPGRGAALFFALLLNFTASLWLGPGLATIQDLVLPRMRGVATAAFLLLNTLVGLALGPYVMGRLSVASGDLRVGISLGLAGYAVGAVLLARAMTTFAADERA